MEKGRVLALAMLSRCLLTVLGFNVAKSGGGQKYMVRSLGNVDGSDLVFEGTSFYGFDLQVKKLISAGNQGKIRVSVGAPTEHVKTFTDTTTEEGGGVIKEPDPVLRAAVKPTTAMGSLYICEMTDAFLMNTTGESTLNCSSRAEVDRDLNGFEISDRDALGISLSGLNSASGATDDEQLLTCAHLRLHDCVSNFKAEGACYFSEKVPGRGDSKLVTRWRKRVPCRDSCFEKPIDLIFVLDGSHSVTNASFEKVKKWVQDVTEGFDIATDTQVGVVQYSYFYPNRAVQKYIKTEIELGNFPNKKEFDDRVAAIVYHGYSTYTAHAINKTVRDDFNGPASRYPKARRVMILLTDGNADDSTDLPYATAYAKREGVETFAVGVANYVFEQLVTIAGGNRENVITVQNFDDLTKIVSQLQRGIQVMEGDTTDPGVTNELMQCQAGISSTVDKTGRLVLGTVGAYDWSGTFTVYSSTTDLVPDIPDFEQVRSVLPLRPKESYLGYSVTTGFYEGPTIGEYIAGGAPRYVLEGAVVVYRPNTRDNNKNFTNSHTIRPPIDPQTMTRQLGSYFGGSLLSADLNGDGFDELLVGAPLYIGNNYDEGRVFVYVANGTDSVALWADPSYKPLELVGEHRPGGRFGTAMAVAGDLNQDGYNDVIIGAPLTEGDKGAIFVYHGSATGIDTTLKQVILASSLQGKNLQYFGQSLQGGVDLDGNRYPDVAVGAPKSDTVVIFRTRPVVKLTSRLTFSKTSVDILECFNTPNRQCVNLTSCLSYNGTSTETHLQILYNTTIDTTLNRIEFRTLANATTGDFVDSGSVNLTKNVEQCWTRLIYVKQNIRDYTSALTASMTYDLTAEHKALPLSSVRDPSIPNMVKTETEFSKKCGPDKVCSYDLQVAATITLPSKVYLPGTTVDLSNNGSTLVVTRDTYVQPVTVRVNVSNAGENAFDTRIHIDYTSALSWTVMEDIQSSNNYLPCVQEVSDLTRPNGKVLRYVHNTTLGSIMRENDWCSFVLRFSTNSLKTSGDVSPVDVSVLAQTAVGYENDTNKADNKWNTTHNVLYTSAAELAKKLIPDEALFNFTDTNDTVVSVHEVGNGSADLTIQYEVKGLGFATIPVSTLSLSFPSKLNAYTHLLYPYQVDCIPSVSTRCTCDQTLVNPYQLSLDPPNENNTNGPNVTMYPYPVPFTAPVTFDCSPSSTNKSTCQTIMCNVYDLGELDKVTFTAKFRLWTKAFNFENLNDTSFKSSITHDTTPSKLMIFPDGSSTSIITKVIDFPVKKYYPPIPPEEQADLLWVYIVAAIAGLLLLIIIILIMWKTGFFKSKYADMKQEALEWNEANTNGAMDQSTEGMLES